MNRHCLLNHASLAGLALRAYMLLNHIQAFNNNLVELWHSPRDCSLLSLILTCDNQDGITLLDIHLGEVERLFLFLLYCHLYSSTLPDRQFYEAALPEGVSKSTSSL